MNTMKVFVADDHNMIRKAWVLYLKDLPYIDVVGDASNGAEVLKFMEKNKVDVLLLDIDMPLLNGIETAGFVKKKWPWVKIVVLTMFKEVAYLKKMMSLGASAYLTKNSSFEELEEAFRVISEGKKYICDEVNVRLLSEINPSGNPSDDRFDQLSKRELEIIQLVSKGLSSKEISEKLEISMKTVESHRGNIYRKLNVKNVAELLRMAKDRLLIN